VNDIQIAADPAIASALAAMLRGDTALPVTEPLIEAAAAHGIDAILARSAAASTASPFVAAQLKARLAGQQIRTAAQDEDLTRVLACLADAGIDVLIFKGAHLAHTVYPAPGLRPRSDSDLLIPEADRARIEPIVSGAGYQRLPHVRGSIILGQCHFRRTDRAGIVHALDVHWRLTAPLLLDGALPAEGLRAASVTVPALGPHARGPSRPDALLIACLHLAAHHRFGAILLWLLDIASLADSLSPEERETFLRRATEAHVATLCLAAIRAARRYFDGAALLALSSELRARTPAAGEPAARLLAATRPIHELWLDVRSAGTWRRRAALLREHLHPDADYMRMADPSARWLALAYARRAVRGLSRWTSAAHVSAGDRRTAAPAGPTGDSAGACGLPRGSGTNRSGAAGDRACAAADRAGAR
jgi:hypothetical protein